MKTQRFTTVFFQILTLSSVGGQILSLAVRRMLQELIQNNVAKCINWTGQGEKLAFKDLFLRKVLESSYNLLNICLLYIMYALLFAKLFSRIYLLYCNENVPGIAFD